MKYAILLLLLAGCAGTDAKPDEFNVTFGAGDTDSSGKLGKRPTSGDSESQWATVGWTWYIGDVEHREHEAAYLEALKLPPPAPVVVAPVVVREEPKPEPVPEPAPEPKTAPAWLSVVLGIATVAATVIGILNRMGKVNWLEHKEKHE